MTREQQAADKIRELSGDIADTLAGSSGPGCELTYRGTLLHELLQAAMVLQSAYLADSARLAEAEAERNRYKAALEEMLSPEFDWEDGDIGVAYKFRLIARAALRGEKPSGHDGAKC